MRIGNPALIREPQQAHLTLLAAVTAAVVAVPQLLWNSAGQLGGGVIWVLLHLGFNMQKCMEELSVGVLH